MIDCFISYRRTPSASQALLIQEKLKNQHGIDAYVDVTRTDSTKVQFPERLMQAIEAAPVFVCLLGNRDGQHTLESEWVLKEIDRAHELKKFCIPVFQESYTPVNNPSDAVNYLLSFDGVHIFDQKNLMMDASVADIAKLVIPHRAKKRRSLIPFAIVAIFGLVAVIAAVVINFSAFPTPVERTFEDGITMMSVPAGCFMMGSNVRTEEQPVHEVCFDEPFWIDKTEVTQLDFERLGGQKQTFPGLSSDLYWCRGDYRPVDRINWFEARDFCELRGARLPTEAEWEYVARGPNSLEYPWGNQWNANNAAWNTICTAEVGSFPAGASWVGALDMSGNVFEWTSSLYEPYPYSAADGRERETDDSSDVSRAMRGGSWDPNWEYHRLRGAARDADVPINARDTYRVVGFRCARDYVP